MMGSTRFLLFFTILFGWTLACLAGQLQVSFIDVGQADSILVQFPTGQTMLVDAGNQADGADVVKYLKSRGVKRIDILVATHPHEDHIGGMPAVIRAFPIGKVWDSGFNQGSQTQAQFLAAVKKEQCQFGKPKQGFTRDIGKVKIEVLAPGPAFITGSDSDANDNSLVLRLVYNQVSVLLPGDMEKEERDAYGPWPKTTILKVAHHGSENGTDAKLLNEVQSSYAAISVAAMNSHGHPSKDVLALLKQAGVKTYLTRDSGTIIFISDGKTITVKTVKTAKGSNSARTSNPTVMAPSGGGGTDTVYITNAGRKYHRAGCRYLARSSIPISRADAIARGYEPCKVCDP